MAVFLGGAVRDEDHTESGFDAASTTTIGPEFNVDLIEGTPTYVFGVSFGVGL